MSPPPARGSPPSGAGKPQLSRERPEADIKLGSTNLNPPGLSLLELVREDLRTHDDDPLSLGFWALAVHRFGNWRMGIRPKPVRAPFSVLYKALSKGVQIACGVEMDYTIKIGRHVKIWHVGALILAAQEIGEGTHIRGNCVVGKNRTDDPRWWRPIIEERVEIAAGAVIAGAIRIGHDSIIGANAVVLEDVPPWSLVVGVPARILRRKDAPPLEETHGARGNGTSTSA
ncbi:MAG: transferase [Deltaproteobacteria bacterium]|nr:transferase [Deltaproteobacteria bacterium]